MRKRGCTALLFALWLLLGLSQAALAAGVEDLILKKEADGKYGVVDKAGKVIVPADYDFASIGENGVITVYLEGEDGETQGLFDWTGREILPADYQNISLLEDGTIAAGQGSWQTEEKYGLFDREGRELLPVIYDEIGPLSEGLRNVKLDGRAGYLDEDLQVALPLEYTYATPFQEGIAKVGKSFDGDWSQLYGVIDRTGQEVLPLQYNALWIEYEQGCIDVTIYHAEGGRSGLYDLKGQVILPVEYDGISTYGYDGCYQVSKWTEEKKLEGLVDSRGREILPLGRYDYIGKPTDGLWVVGRNEKYGCLDDSFREVIPLVYDRLTAEKGCLLAEKDGRAGVLDRTGKAVIPLEYDYLYPSSVDEDRSVCEVTKNGKKGLLTYPEGKVLVPLIYDELQTLTNGLAEMWTDGHWGVLDWRTGEIIVPAEYDGVATWVYDLGDNIMVVKDGLYGAYDKGGREVFSCQFPTEERLRGAIKAGSSDSTVVETGSEEAGLEVTWYPEAAYIIRRYGTDRMLLVKDGKSGLFGLDGRQYTDFIFDAVGEFDEYGRALAAQNGKWGRIDLDGNVLQDFICVNEQEVELGVKFVGPKGRDEPPYALVKTDGTRLTDYKYWAVRPFSGGLARVADGVNWTYLTPEGVEIFPFGRYSWIMEDFGEADDGYVIVRRLENGESVYNVIDKTGREIFSPIARELWRAGEGLWGYRDRETDKVGFLDQTTGQIAIPAQYDYYIGVTGKVSHMMGNKFYDGVATVYLITTGEDYRIESFSIDAKGNRVEEPEQSPKPYEPPYHEGLCKASRWDGFQGPGEGTYGFVDEAGEVVVPFLYDDVGEFDHGYASVRKNGVYGLLKNPLAAAAEEKALAELDILWLDDAEGGLAPLGSDQLVTDYVVRGTGRWLSTYGDYGLWSVEGEHLLTADEAGAAGSYPRGPSGARIYAMSGEKIDRGELGEDTRYTDILGRTYLESELWDWDAPWNPPELDCSRAVNPETNRIEDGKYFYADPWTGEVVLPAIYDEAVSFSEGVGIVTVGGDRFAIDRTGERLFDLNAYEVGYPLFTEGRLQVRDKETGKQGFLDKTGQLIGEGLVWDNDDGGNYWFHKGAMAVSREGRWGIIDRNGEEIIPYLFDGVSNFDNGIAVIALRGRKGILRDPRVKDTVSGWAADEVAAAAEAGYVTESCREYRTFTITRRQFAQLAVNYLEKTTGETIVPAPGDTFTDTADETVLKAYAAGVVQGVGDHKFSPGGLLTREQLAAMLWRAMSKAGVTVEAPADLSAYADGGEVSAWARDSLSALVGLEVMAGTGEKALSPKDSCTVEQAILLLYRAAK